MAELNRAEEVMQREATRRVGEPGASTDRAAIYSERLRALKEERGAKAVVKAAERGAPGLAKERESKILLQLSDNDGNPSTTPPTPSSRERMRQRIVAENRFIQYGMEGSTDPALLRDTMITHLESSSMGIAFQGITGHAEQQAAARAMLEDPYFLAVYDGRMKDISERDVNPSQEDINNHSANLRATIDTLPQEMKEAIAAQQLIEEQVEAAARATFPTNGPGSRPNEAQMESARKRVRGGITRPTAAEITARANLYTVANDPSIDEAALKIVARQDLITTNQRAMQTDMDSLMQYSVNEVQRAYIRDAQQASLENINALVGDRIVQNRMERLQRAFNGNNADDRIQNMFRLYQTRGIDAIFTAEEMTELRKDPAKLEEIKKTVGEYIITSRLSLPEPPISRDDYLRLARNNALGDTLEERVDMIEQMFMANQHMKDVLASGQEGGQIDRNFWPKVRDAVRRAGSIGGPILLATILATMFGIVASPIGAGVAMLSTAGSVIGGAISFNNDAHGRRYEAEAAA